MENLYSKLMSMDDSEFDEIERAEKALLESLNAKKLHEFDNIAVGKNGEAYAICDLAESEEIIKNGNLYAKTKKSVKRGEKVEI